MAENETESFYPADPKQWRKWLQKNHDKKKSVWLIYYYTKSGVPTLTWSEAVDEALCFGWIDSKKKPIDSEKYMQFFSKRKATSTWSKVNKAKIEKLIDEKKMTPAGLASVELAKQNGTWTLMDEIEEMILLQDLVKAFKSRPGSEEFFMSLSKSVRKIMLHWVVTAKRPETRQKRVEEIALQAGKGKKPGLF